jgi:RHS repeat-associated protein
LDLTNPSSSRYYILDALGHTRLLLDNTGNITDTYVYDAWGNLLKGSEWSSPNPFTWNGAYGYEWIEFTGLFHVGAREYDPRTARWLQRDPADAGGGHPNVYLYCKNEPLNKIDPTGWQDLCKEQISTLLFTGDKLKIFNAQGQLVDMVSAYSGAPLSTPFDQPVRDKGPIPAGTYWIDPTKVQSATTNPYLLLRYRHQYYPSDSAILIDTDWGERRVLLQPDATTDTLGRSRFGFFLHGGTYIGSAGCIDIGHNDKRVLDALAAQKTKVKVVVIYLNWNQRVPYNYGLSGKGREGQVPWNPGKHFRPTHILGEDGQP